MKIKKNKRHYHMHPIVKTIWGTLVTIFALSIFSVALAYGVIYLMLWLCG